MKKVKKSLTSKEQQIRVAFQLIEYIKRSEREFVFIEEEWMTVLIDLLTNKNHFETSSEIISKIVADLTVVMKESPDIPQQDRTTPPFAELSSPSHLPPFSLFPKIPQ